MKYDHEDALWRQILKASHVSGSDSCVAKQLIRGSRLSQLHVTTCRGTKWSGSDHSKLRRRLMLMLRRLLIVLLGIDAQWTASIACKIILIMRPPHVPGGPCLQIDY